METIIYGRVSTNSQNSERQESEGLKTFIDVCSGVVPFSERKEAKKLLKYCSTNAVQVQVLDIDRLGRNLIDILSTIELFRSNNIEIFIKSLGVSSTSPLFDTIIGIFGTVAQLERSFIKERTRAGIEVAKAQGKFKGRKVGTGPTDEAILEKHKDIAEFLIHIKNVSKVARLSGHSRITVLKVKNILLKNKKPDTLF